MGSSACSASTKAAMPPCFCASAMTCSAMVVLPEDSGPKISITRPRGMPPTPSAASNEMDPVEITEMGTTASLVPSFMIEPLPNCFSICEIATSTARLFSVFSSATIAAPGQPRDREIAFPQAAEIYESALRQWAGAQAGGRVSLERRMFTDRVVYTARARRSEEIAKMRLRKYPTNHYHTLLRQ